MRSTNTRGTSTKSPHGVDGTVTLMIWDQFWDIFADKFGDLFGNIFWDNYSDTYL